MCKKYGINQICKMVNVNKITIHRWYKWYNDPYYEKPEDLPELPEIKKLGKRIYLTEEDVEQLKKFKEYLPKGKKGIMGNFNAQYWQKRGKAALERKGQYDLVEKYFHDKNY